jgi:glycosyltransferase involved in cell wall biosynthesis
MMDMDMNVQEIDILLSTFNGARYIVEQIESLLAQTNRAWRLHVRDDGSTDGTLAILRGYQERFPRQINVIEGKNVGVVQSFNELLKLSAAPYVMFCDQDDKWFDDKVEVMMHTVKEAEAGADQPAPVLAFSDLALMAEDGSPMNVGFWERHGVNPDHTSLNRLLLQNVVTGCACMFNRALIQKALPIPKEAVMHDWWLALNAALFGRLVAIRRQTVNYRQHTGNQVGARGVNLGRLREMLKAGESVKRRLAGILQRSSVQASVLLSAHGDEMSDRQRQLISNFVRIPNAGWFSRKLFFIREKMFFSSKLRNLCLLIC